jgi:hypothetical protein
MTDLDLTFRPSNTGCDARVDMRPGGGHLWNAPGTDQTQVDLPDGILVAFRGDGSAALSCQAAMLRDRREPFPSSGIAYDPDSRDHRPTAFKENEDGAQHRGRRRDHGIPVSDL